MTPSPPEVRLLVTSFAKEADATAAVRTLVLEKLAACGTTLLTPSKTRTATNLRRERALATTRLVIESVFSNPKEQMRLERHPARTPARPSLTHI